MKTPDDRLRRGFGLSTATYVVIASMVGAGILVSPGYLMASLRSYPAIFGLWALGGLLAMCGALCVAELAASLPRAGGEYVYLREAYGPMPADVLETAAFGSDEVFRTDRSFDTNGTCRSWDTLCASS